MPVLKVGDDRALHAAVLAFKAADRDLRKQINAATRDKFNEPWRSGITGRTRTTLERKVLAPGARVAAGNPPEFRAAASRRALSGGLVPDTDWPMIEFGTNDREKTKTYRRRGRSGGTFEVKRRHTRRQLPRRRPRGPVFNTLADMQHRVPRLWAQLIVKVYADAAEGR